MPYQRVGAYRNTPEFRMNMPIIFDEALPQWNYRVVFALKDNREIGSK